MTSSRLSERLAAQRRRGDSGSKWIRVVMAVLATIGVIDTGSITLKAWGVLPSLSCSSKGFFGCNGCEKVLSIAWGSLFGQPLSLFGFLAYGAVLLMAVVTAGGTPRPRSEAGRFTAAAQPRLTRPTIRATITPRNTT